MLDKLFEPESLPWIGSKLLISSGFVSITGDWTAAAGDDSVTDSLGSVSAFFGLTDFWEDEPDLAATRSLTIV